MVFVMPIWRIPKIEGEKMSDKKDIKIFVSHRIDEECEIIHNPLFVNVRCGAVFDTRKNVQMAGDDIGEHISQKRPYLSELTVQYWSWKNVEADYYGLCHYRRYLNYSKQTYKRDAFGNVIDHYINERTERRYGLWEEQMRDVIEGSDLVIAQTVNVRMLPGHYKNVKEQYYKSCAYLQKKDIDMMETVVCEKYPKYREAVESYLYGKDAFFCNLYVMKKEVFDKYCNWLFPILDELEKRIDIRNYCEEARRTLGHLAERLFGIYLTYLKIHTTLKITQLQTVVFLNPQHQEKITFQEKDVIPIVFAANNQFAGPLSVAMQSVIESACDDRKYAIVILESDITEQNKELLRWQIQGKKNFQIRFYNALALVEGYHLRAHDHISEETFFRFLIQDILPDCSKAVYIDCDLVVKKDLAALYDTNIEGYSFAAVRDIDFIGQINGAVKTMNEYAKKRLRLKDPYAYAQAGVLLLNLKEMRRQYSMKEWLQRASENYRYSDQDVLNKYCQGKIYFLDLRWNVIFDCDYSRIQNIIRMAPEELYRAYREARKDPYIIHFAGHQKPWKQLPADFQNEFWTVAKRTPFYELLLYGLHEQKMWDIANFHYSQCHKGAFLRLKGILFRLIEGLFPLETGRRRCLHFTKNVVICNMKNLMKDLVKKKR